VRHAVLIRREPGGVKPVVVHEGEQLETPRGVSWQFVGAFASEQEACDALARLLAPAEKGGGAASAARVER
jgi:hypothetical protein